jgi:hypothetical protein
LFPLGALALLAVACLPDDPAVQGRLLHPGPDVVAPRFRTLDGEPWVLYDVRISPAENGLARHFDLHLARFSDGEHRLVLANRADRADWPVITDADRAGFYMVDERDAPGLGLPMATLVRLRLSTGVVETIDDVLDYGIHPERRRFYYQRYLSGSSRPELHLRDLAGNEANLGPSKGPVAFRGPERFYFLSGPDSVLSRVSGISAEAQPLRPHVSRFSVHGDETFAVVVVSQDGRVFTRVLDLATGEERALAVENPCCWLGIEGNSFVYGEAARDGNPAVLHRYDFPSGVDQALPLPEGLTDVRDIIDRPGAPESLIVDGHGRAAIVRQPAAGEGPPDMYRLPMPVSAPVYSGDGRFLLYLDEEPPPPPPALRRNPVGRLMALDAADTGQPPRVLSPLGTSCLVQPRGYEPNVGGPGKVLFWAYYGLGATDLYLSDLDSGETRKLAVGVGPMTMLQSSLLGVTRIGQDQTGDLVQKDLVTGAEQVIEHGVLTMASRLDPMLGNIVTFVVRERNAGSPRNGLWAAPLPAF